MAKRRWAGLIGANGILVLVPVALFLVSNARAAEFDTIFYAIQALELGAGAANIAQLGRNMRDGPKMKGRLRRRSARSRKAPETGMTMRIRRAGA